MGENPVIILSNWKLTVAVNAIGFHKFEIRLGNSPLLATMSGALFTWNGVRLDPFEYREIELRNILLCCLMCESWELG